MIVIYKLLNYLNCLYFKFDTFYHSGIFKAISFMIDICTIEIIVLGCIVFIKTIFNFLQGLKHK